MKKVSQIFKETVDSQLSQDLKSSSGVFVIGCSGIGSAVLTDLRKNLKSIGSKLFITKNKFSSLAFKNSLDSTIVQDVTKFLNGPVGLIFVKDDPVPTCKTLTEFAKTCEKMELKGGYLNQQIINKQDFKAIASIPPRQVLYQQIAMTLNAPIAKLAMSLNQVIGKLAYALNDLINKKQK